jgi:hypothetical protein
MSELEVPYIYGANRYHDLPSRTEEQIDAAYYGAFTSPDGQIIMDDLYAKVCCSKMDDIRALGQVDLRNYLLVRMRAHLARMRAYERGGDGTDR